MKIENENPTQAEIKFIPNYFSILFFSIFVFTFISIAVFIDKMTINGVYREPTLGERLLYSLAGIVHRIWCYLRII